MQSINNSISLKVVTLPLDEFVQKGDSVSLQYLPGTNKVQDLAGNIADGFTVDIDTSALVDAPVLQTIVIEGVGSNMIDLDFDMQLLNIYDLTSDNFIFNFSGGAVNFDYASIGGSQVSIHLDRYIQYGETGTVQYVPGVVKLQGLDNNWVLPFTEDVTNNAIDPPVFDSYTISQDGDTIELLCSTELVAIAPDGNDFILNMSGGEVHVTNASVPPDLELELSRYIQYGETGTIQYIPGVNKLQGLFHNYVLPFTESLINNAIAPPVITSAEVGTVSAYSWNFVLDKAIAATMPAASSFSVAGITFASISKVGSNQVELISNEPATYAHGNYSAAYTMPGSNQLQGLNNNYVVSQSPIVVTNNMPVPGPNGDPSSLTLTVISYTQINLAWINGATNHPAYQIWRKPVGGAYTLIDTTAADATTYNNTGITGGNYWTYQVRGVLAGNFSNYSNEASNSIPLVIFKTTETVAWYRSDQLSTITKDGSDFVSRWNDFLGSGRDLIQATGAKQPKWINGDGLLFVPSQTMVASFTFAQPEFVYIVLKTNNATSSILFDGNAGDRMALYYRYSSSKSGIYALGATVLLNDSFILNNNGYVIVRALFDGANSKLIYNNLTPKTGTATSPGSSSANGFRLATYGGTATFAANENVIEAILRKVSDTTQNEADIYNYLSTKYGIT
jgi:hypothetical protein